MVQNTNDKEINTVRDIIEALSQFPQDAIVRDYYGNKLKVFLSEWNVDGDADSKKEFVCVL